jgi:hypothetical protein
MEPSLPLCGFECFHHRKSNTFFHCHNFFSVTNESAPGGLHNCSRHCPRSMNQDSNTDNDDALTLLATAAAGRGGGGSAVDNVETVDNTGATILRKRRKVDRERSRVSRACDRCKR